MSQNKSDESTNPQPPLTNFFVIVVLALIAGLFFVLRIPAGTSYEQVMKNQVKLFESWLTTQHEICRTESGVELTREIGKTTLSSLRLRYVATPESTIYAEMHASERYDTLDDGSRVLTGYDYSLTRFPEPTPRDVIEVGTARVRYADNVARDKIWVAITMDGVPNVEQACQFGHPYDNQPVLVKSADLMERDMPYWRNLSTAEGEFMYQRIVSPDGSASGYIAGSASKNTHVPEVIKYYGVKEVEKGDYLISGMSMNALIDQLTTKDTAGM